ncbi:hypothetical protein NB311A_13046 [Nitrobacter sp. Nb-311A]|nr:hypothetical protein NB311A_13046 [Nitrobacter sp. Nb-311A]
MAEEEEGEGVVARPEAARRVALREQRAQERAPARAVLQLEGPARQATGLVAQREAA